MLASKIQELTLNIVHLLIIVTSMISALASTFTSVMIVTNARNRRFESRITELEKSIIVNGERAIPDFLKFAMAHGKKKRGRALRSFVRITLQCNDPNMFRALTSIPMNSLRTALIKIDSTRIRQHAACDEETQYTRKLMAFALGLRTIEKLNNEVTVAEHEQLQAEYGIPMYLLGSDQPVHR
jgi:hypothetical protein